MGTSAAPRVSPESAGSEASVIRGISWVGAGHVVSQLAWFSSLILVAALVSPSAFGSVAIAMVMVQVAWLLVGSGTRGSFVVAKEVTRAQVRYATAVNVGAGLAVGLLVVGLSGSVLDALVPGSDPDVLRVLALSIALYGLSIVPLALLQKELLFKRHAAANAGAALLASAGCAAAAVLGAGVWALVLRQVLFQALLATFAWTAARGLLPAESPGRRDLRRAARPPMASSFFILAVISFVALNMDYVIVGRVANVAQLGLYSLAFTIAFAPLTQFAWQIGKVLFPAAAREDSAAAAGIRAVKAVRLTALMLLPLVPIAVGLAPAVLPPLLGSEWESMVVPFQILVAVGVVHALLSILREFLLGSGSVGFCVRLEAVWVAATAASLVVLVQLDGIRGAALAHLLLVAPLAVVYAVWGGRRLGSNARVLWGAVRGSAGLLAVEAVALAFAVVGIRLAGAPSDAAWLGGTFAAAATLAGLVVFGHRRPVREAIELVRSARAAGATA